MRQIIARSQESIHLGPTFGLTIFVSLVLLFAFLGIWIGLAELWPNPTSEQKEIIAAMNWAFKIMLGEVPGVGLGKIAR